jgi:Tfp pilus assembly protein PilF
MTDHKIVRLKPAGDLLAEKAELQETPATSYRGEVVPYLPPAPAPNSDDLLYGALAQITDRSNLNAGLNSLTVLIGRLHPAQPGFYTGLAEGYLSAGDIPKAIASFDEALRRSPNSEIIQLERGNAFIAARQWANAETALRTATKLQPKDAAAWTLLGWTLWQQDKSAEAKSDLEKAIELDPDAPDAHNYLASLLMGSGDAPGAEKQFRAALTIDPGVAAWQSNLALLVASRGEMAEASEHFERSIRLDPGYLPARLNYARVLANLNNFAAADQQVKAALAADPKLAPAHQLMGSILSAKGDSAGAIRELKIAITLNPNDGRTHYELGIVLGQSGDSPGAIEQLTIAARDPDRNVAAAAAEMLRRMRRP